MSWLMKVYKVGSYRDFYVVDPHVAWFGDRLLVSHKSIGWNEGNGRFNVALIWRGSFFFRTWINPFKWNHGLEIMIRSWTSKILSIGFEG